VNAYQQQYPPFPELAQMKKNVSNMQSQTDSLIIAAQSDNWETRQKLQTALEQLGDCTENQAELIAAEERETALKAFAEQEAAKLESLRPVLIKEWRPLHLPLSCVHHEPTSNESANRELQKIKEHVVQRDSVTRLRNMLNENQREASVRHEQTESSIHLNSRKLPRRVFDTLREPPKIIPQASESLISLAEKLRYLDFANAGWTTEQAAFDFAEKSSDKSLHQKLKQLPAAALHEQRQSATTGTTYSLSYSLQSWQRNGGDL
jgi:hypothetical protein